jgi:hypothetical protein
MLVGLGLVHVNLLPRVAPLTLVIWLWVLLPVAGNWFHLSLLLSSYVYLSRSSGYLLPCSRYCYHLPQVPALGTAFHSFEGRTRKGENVVAYEPNR